jgi:hypothetical protein
MATRQQIQTDDEELNRLRAGDVAGARQVLRRKKVEVEEEQALDTFMFTHPEVMNMIANRSMLLAAARAFGGVVTAAILELALTKIGASLAMTPPAEPEPTAAELAAAEKKRLWGMSVEELRQEVRQNSRKRFSIDETISPEVAAMTSRADVDKLSAAQLRKLLYREGSGQARTGNIRRINELLQGKVN